jgi:2-(3-amino-3-carboxypropyl)histidine synthase
MLDLGEFEIDLSIIKNACEEHKPGRVMVQIPGILHRYITAISNAIAYECSVEVYTANRPTFGACDLMDTSTLKDLEIQMLVNFGHSELPYMKQKYEKEHGIQLVFIEMPSKLTELNITEKDIEKLGSSVVLASTVQYSHLLEKLSKYLEEHGITTYIGKGDGRIKYPGQILGCNYSSITNLSEFEVDSYLYVGTGRFHPLGIALAVDKPLFVFDPHLGLIYSFASHRERFLRKRHALIATAANAERFAVVICTKPGQNRTELARNLHEKLKNHNKTSVLTISNELDPNDFDYADYDIIVSTACPRIALDDYERYKKPVITPLELEIALDERAWEDYFPDMIEG